MIPFNKPYLTGREIKYIQDVLKSRILSGNGKYTKLCQDFFEKKYYYKKCLLTSSCTDALELASILIGLNPGDEVIMPSYTFVSTANAFILRGCKILFADSRPDHPGIEEDEIESLITSRTKAIVPVHYAGISCDMQKILGLAKKYNLYLIEDAAQAVDSYFITEAGNKIPLGSFGNCSCFSFHETKNIVAGEAGMIVVNDEKLRKRSEVIWEKGTNRSAFYRGEVDKYNWIDLGSSFLPPEITASFLWGQLQYMDEIQNKRGVIWQKYHESLQPIATNYDVSLPKIPKYSSNNYHIYYLVCTSAEERNDLMDFLNKKQCIRTVFHYLSLHTSPYFKSKHDGRALINCDKYSNCLLRLPIYPELKSDEQDHIIESILNYYQK